MNRVTSLAAALGLLAGGASVAPAFADDAPAKGGCPVTYNQLKQALTASVKASGGPTNGGLDFNMWAAAVNRDGFVC